MNLLVFFFSSRRRHTRSLCDWSSDVCSSDLCILRSPWKNILLDGALRYFSKGISKYITSLPFASRTPVRKNRSEERRVGKESIYKWLPGKKSKSYSIKSQSTVARTG